SVRRMHRTSVAISHAGGTFPAKKHFRILAGLLAPNAEWVDGLGESFRNGLSALDDVRLDCGCALEKGCFDTYSGGLNVTSKEGSLMLFLFRLLARLQALGTVPAI